MIFSFSSLVSTLFFNSIAIIILYLIVRSKALILRTSVFYLFLCMFLALFRPLAPFEFPFTKTIPIENIWPHIFRLFNDTLFSFQEFDFSLNLILIVIWILGGVVFCLRIVVTYIYLFFYVQRLKPCTNNVIISTFNSISNEEYRTENFRLVMSDINMSPFVFGIRKPYIVLPVVDLSSTEWSYILKHEIAHYHHGDLLKAIMTEFVSAIYWWNPFLYMIKKQMNKIKEIHIDSIVTRKWDSEEKIKYMKCIVKVTRMGMAGMLVANKKNASHDFSRDFTVSQRLDFLINSMTNKYKPTIGIQIILALLMSFIILAPSLYVFEPSSMLPEHAAENTFSLNAENAYFIMTDDGEYDLYLDGEYLITLEGPKIENIPIYDNKGVSVQNEEKNQNY